MDLDAAELQVRQVAVELFGRLDLRSYPTSRAARERCRSPASSWTLCAVTCTTDLRSGPIFGIRLGAQAALTRNSAESWL